MRGVAASSRNSKQTVPNHSNHKHIGEERQRDIGFFVHFATHAVKQLASHHFTGDLLCVIVGRNAYLLGSSEQHDLTEGSG